jgi:signal transduction histidine kinase
MVTPPRPALRRYSIVPLVVALALLARGLLLGREMPFLLLWPGVMVCAWFGGLGPGLVATCLSALVTTFLFLEPPDGLSVVKPEDWTGVALFMLLGSALSLLCEMLRRARHKVEHYAQELRRRAEDLVEADLRKNEFLATLAHELRNPLAPLRNAVELLRRSQGDAAVSEQARNMMERQLAQLVRLIDDLLDVSRISRGRVRLRKERVELAAVVHSAVEVSRPLIEAQGHELTVTLPAEAIVLDADATRLAQVISNLLNNAAKYTEKGGDVWLTAKRQGDEAVVSVRDTGIGIAAEHLAYVFEIFSQLTPALERSQGGLGIGLSLVRGLIELHGGRVEARSEGTGRGSEFIVRLPVVDEPVRHEVQEPAAGHPVVEDRKRRILAVDDNRDAADSLALILQMMGHEVQTAYDGREGVELAEAFRPDVVLLDIGMPRLNGYEAARHIRQQPWGQGVALIALTGWGQEEDKRRALEAGFDHHLTKPVEAVALEKLLARLTPA